MISVGNNLQYVSLNILTKLPNLTADTPIVGLVQLIFCKFFGACFSVAQYNPFG